MPFSVEFQIAEFMPAVPLHISLIAIPDAVLSTLSGIFDVLSSFGTMSALDDAVPSVSPFRVEIVGAREGPVDLASGLPIPTHRSIGGVAATDIVIVPSLLVPGERWQAGRYPALVEWLGAMHRQGATMCSACSGLFLLAETGAFDGVPSTVHWVYAAKFKKSFPAVPVTPERALVVSGDRQQLISSGASTSWHDLVLHLVARHAGPAAALAMAHFYALNWHRDGLAPYIVFTPPRDHGDAAVLDAQTWLASHYSVAGPVEQMVNRSRLAARTFKRRFTKATGLAPMVYLQRLRIEEAKRQLERTEAAIDEISWKVGYEDPAFFRRLFKRVTGLTPGAYRRNFDLRAIAA